MLVRAWQGAHDGATAAMEGADVGPMLLGGGAGTMEVGTVLDAEEVWG